jgi:hypothetical protein
MILSVLSVKEPISVAIRASKGSTSEEERTAEPSVAGIVGVRSTE